MPPADVDEATAGTLSEATEKLGFRRYLWLYFFVVPLAAVSASTVAIVIAALQGLEAHVQAPRLFAIVVMIGLKLVAAIAVSYLVAAGMGLISVTAFSHFQSNRKASPWGSERLFPQLFRDQALIAISLIYGGTLLAYSIYRYIWPDLIDGWEILTTIAATNAAQ